jgi:hypothetical protein
MPNFALRQKGQPIGNPSLISRAACQLFYHVAFRNGWHRGFATAFFREPPDAFFVGGDPLFGRRQ